MKVKHCLQCGLRINGRSDKKYCSDACRTDFNNKLKTDNNYVRMVSKTLRKNRLILEKLTQTNNYPNGITKRLLIDMGYNFNYHTHVYYSENNIKYVYCFEFGFCMAPNGSIELLDKDKEYELLQMVNAIFVE